MTDVKRFHALIATDGSAAAKAAVATAVRFPWPDGSRAFGVVASQDVPIPVFDSPCGARSDR